MLPKRHACSNQFVLTTDCEAAFAVQRVVLGPCRSSGRSEVRLAKGFEPPIDFTEVLARDGAGRSSGGLLLTLDVGGEHKAGRFCVVPRHCRHGGTIGFVAGHAKVRQDSAPQSIWKFAIIYQQSAAFAIVSCRRGTDLRKNPCDGFWRDSRPVLTAETSQIPGRRCYDLIAG